jgi:hypothetical protein
MNDATTRAPDEPRLDCLSRAVAAHRQIEAFDRRSGVDFPLHPGGGVVVPASAGDLERIDRTTHAFVGHPLPTLDCYVPPGAASTVEEHNQFQSAGVMLRRLAIAIGQWRRELPPNVQPGLLALLNGGVQMDVEGLSQESFHGIRIDGRVDGTPCVVLAHQATVQLLCIEQPVRPPELPRRRPIGFVIEGERTEA